jgi:hypothetical protein
MVHDFPAEFEERWSLQAMNQEESGATLPNREKI